GEINGLENDLKDETLKGKWDVKQIEESGVKGYVIRGSFQSDQPFEPQYPFEPFEPLNPRRRPSSPERPFSRPEETSTEKCEPLIDIFEGENEVKIYAELPGEEKDDIYLNVAEGEVEIKAKNFYKTIKVPVNINIEKASSKHRNSVLEIILPKKKVHEDSKRNITIE
ncbi:MAG: Hsp20/alpha crystallin family protein, partial [Candidatus Bathyarchaeota archaeon]